MPGRVGIRRMISVLCALLVFGVLLPNARPAAAAEQSPWSKVVNWPKGVNVNSIAMIDANNALVAASRQVRENNRDLSKGLLVRITVVNSFWQIVASYPTESSLVAVTATPDGNGWAVGLGGVASRLENGVLRSELLPVPSEARMVSVAIDDTEVWAVGFADMGPTRGFAVRRDRSGWQAVDGLPQAAATRVVARNGTAWVRVGGRVYERRGDGWGDITPDNAMQCASDQVCSVADLAILADGSLTAVANRVSGQPLSFILTYRAGSWQTDLRSDTFPTTDGISLLSGISVGRDGAAFAVGSSYRQIGRFSRAGVVLALQQGRWTEVPFTGVVQKMSVADAHHALAPFDEGILTYGYPYQAGLPFDVRAWVADPQQPGVRYFPETGHTLRGEFRDFWERNGGLQQFGYPLTEEVRVTTNGQLIQVFERAIFELHPQNAAPYNVLLRLLGNELIIGREAEAPFVPRAGSGPGYFPETGHTIAPAFLNAWQTRGGLQVFGYPKSEAFEEVNPADGQVYLVQYFERYRMELHLDLPEPYRISLGLLGNEKLRSWGL